MPGLIERTLWYSEGRETTVLQQRDLVGMVPPAVVLGEAGSGKTRLLEWLAGQPGHALCTARQLVNRHDARTLLGTATTLVVDALDEVAAQRDGDAVDLVLRKLGVLGYPRFVISCRVADWQSAISVAAIGEQYGDAPRELHLEPLSEADATTLLTANLGAVRAAEVIEHFNGYGLHGFLSNPQTLEMIGTVASQGALPRSSSELFERAVDAVWKEHRNGKGAAELTREAALDAAGAAFAALLLTGSETISRKGAAKLEEGELALPEIEAFDAGHVGAVLGTRLFRSVGAERFTYWHRRTGEYLGARWLAARADTRRKRRRLLAMFQGNGLVPASLRGLHAWLALHQELAPAVLAADPMGVIEYGDADVLTTGQARDMLQALRLVAGDNPRFRDGGPYRAQGLVKPALLDEVRDSITDPTTEFGLRLLLLQQLERADIASELSEELKVLVSDVQQPFAARASAAHALRSAKAQPDWPGLVEGLRRMADPDSTRLGAELVQAVGIGNFEDSLFVETILAHAGLTLSSVGQHECDRVVGSLRRMRRDIPANRVGSVLDLTTDYMESLVDRNAAGPDELTDFVVELIGRAIKAGDLTPERMWRWLQAIHGENGYERAPRENLATALGTDTKLRRGVQKLVLLPPAGKRVVWEQLFQLSSRSPALQPDDADFVTLLGELDASDRSDLRWKDLLELCRHNATEGAAVRAAAKPFADHRPDLIEWIDRLAEPRVPEWQERRERERLKRVGKEAADRLKNRTHYAAHVTAMRAGGFALLNDPAKVYMNRFHDMGEGLGAHERVAEWLGIDLAAAAHEGFEAFLTARPRKPSAVEIARSLADNHTWNAGDIIVAALAERRRLGHGFTDLPAERIIAGWLELRSREDERAGLPGLRDALADEIRRRRKWRSAQILIIEPQLKKVGSHVAGLYDLMRSEPDATLATELALCWLQRLKVLTNEPEHELIGRVLSSPRRDELAPIAATRLSQTGLSNDRRRAWLAVQLVVDFQAALKQVRGTSIEKDLVWELREHVGARRSDGRKGRRDLTLEQLEWIVKTFRGPWPATSHPSSSTGDANPWDASDFICSSIARIGDDVSDQARAVMAGLRKVDDSYSYYVRVVSAEQRRKLVETRYSPPTLTAVRNGLEGGPPVDAADLQAVMLEELEVAQARLKGDPLDWYKGFYKEDGTHKNEEDCRDELLKLLDGKVSGVQLRPESHLADDKRVDIECSATTTVMVPVEVKGQWHKALWTAADDQLDKLYSTDWRAERRGIYLVLWFGGAVPLTSAPGGGDPPATPEALQEALTTVSRVCGTGFVKVVVLDLTCR